MTDPLDYLLFFSSDILHIYLGRPDKYEVEFHRYGGRIRLADLYFDKIQGSELFEAQKIDVRFAFRERPDGELAIAALVPDLAQTGAIEQKRWHCFRIGPDIFRDYMDPDFYEWTRVHLEGEWTTYRSPIHVIGDALESINAITQVFVDKKLFRVDKGHLLRLVPPLSNHTHAYQDAHRELYRYTLDAIDKLCLKDLNEKRGFSVPNLDEMRGFVALKHSFPLVKDTLISALKKTAKQRGFSVHSPRSKPEPFPAFRTFFSDLEQLALGLNALLCSLEVAFSLGRNRARALAHLPPHECMDDTETCPRVKSRTVTSVELGVLTNANGVKSDVLVLAFDDGSSVGLAMTGNVADFLAAYPMDASSLTVKIRLLEDELFSEIDIDEAQTTSLVAAEIPQKIQGQKITHCNICEATGEYSVLPHRFLLKTHLKSGAAFVLEPTWNIGHLFDASGYISAALEPKDLHLQFLYHWIPVM